MHDVFYYQMKSEFFLDLDSESFVYLLENLLKEEAQEKQKRNNIVDNGDFAPNKGHTYEKCFVHPTVD